MLVSRRRSLELLQNQKLAETCDLRVFPWHYAWNSQLDMQISSFWKVAGLYNLYWGILWWTINGLGVVGVSIFKSHHWKHYICLNLSLCRGKFIRRSRLAVNKVRGMFSPKGLQDEKNSKIFFLISWSLAFQFSIFNFPTWLRLYFCFQVRVEMCSITAHEDRHDSYLTTTYIGQSSRDKHPLAKWSSQFGSWS